MTALLTFKYVCDICQEVDEFSYKFPRVELTNVIHGRIATYGSYDMCRACKEEMDEYAIKLFREHKEKES